MIDLKLNISGSLDSLHPFVLRLSKDSSEHRALPSFAQYEKLGNDVSVQSKHGSFNFRLSHSDEIEGDICLVFPKENTFLRLIRANSNANTILLTEQCDQACIMCSQPPKNKIYDHYDLYKEALLLCPQNHIIGISGGEPTLERQNLFPFLKDILSLRPDLKFHILTNAQHFLSDDIPDLKDLKNSVLWGVPVYSHEAIVHDEIVGKKGAHSQLMKGLNILFQSGSAVEIRTIILEQNYSSLPLIADFVARHLPLCEIWAIMQLENIGYAKMNWKHIFVDTSSHFSSIAGALSIAETKNINTYLYNFPTCTIPEEWQKYACKSISDWKNKYLDTCNKCSKKDDCCGFFEWYDTKIGFQRIRSL